MSAFQLNLVPLKEPLGFIKVLEWVSAAGAARRDAGHGGAAQSPERASGLGAGAHGSPSPAAARGAGADFLPAAGQSKSAAACAGSPPSTGSGERSLRLEFTFKAGSC